MSATAQSTLSSPLRSVLRAAPIESTLALADLEAFDPHGGSGPENGRRWRCPLPQCAGKKSRSVSVDVQSGAWQCHRCHTTGKLRDRWEDCPPMDRRARACRARHSVFDFHPAPITNATPKDETWRDELNRLQSLDTTPGAKYFERRGVPAELATANGVCYSPKWAPRRAEGKTYSAGCAVVFPMGNQAGEMVAANGRYLSPTAVPKTRTGGDAAHGVFEAKAGKWGAWDAPALILVEGPFDALSLAMAGFPALAMVGCALPNWLPAACAFRRVLIAPDADERGEEAAAEWRRQLAPFCSSVENLQPQNGKDWNEMLLAVGRDVLSDYLALHVLMTPGECAKCLGKVAA